MEAPSGGWPAQDGAPAPPYPADLIYADPRKMGWMRRHAGLIAVAVLVAAVAGAAGAVYVSRPKPYPGPGPTGLTADQRSANSISLSWSNPLSGPRPDKYVVLRDGAVAGTVPGDVNHFTATGLAFATTYDFRVVAHVGGASSPPSPDLRVATLTPPLSQAVSNSSFSVAEKIEAGGSSASDDANGTTWHDNWTFTGSCTLGPCVTRVDGTIDGSDFSAVLTADGHGGYTGAVPINNAYYCGSNQTNYSRSTLNITVRPAAAVVAGTQWQASKLSGGLTWNVAANPNGDCSGASILLSVAG